MFRGAREFLHCNTDGRLDNCTHIAYKPRSRRALARPGFFSDLLRPCASDTTPAAPAHWGPHRRQSSSSNLMFFGLCSLGWQGLPERAAPKSLSSNPVFFVFPSGAGRRAGKIIKFESGFFCFPPSWAPSIVLILIMRQRQRARLICRFCRAVDTPIYISPDLHRVSLAPIGSSWCSGRGRAVTQREGAR